MVKPLIVYCTSDRSLAEELFASLRSRFPGVDLQHYLKGSDLLQALQTRVIDPVIALIDFEFKDSGPEELPGDLLTRRVLKLNPEITVIGYAPGMSDAPVNLGKTVKAAFEAMGAAECIDTKDRVDDLIEELTTWLEYHESEALGRKIKPFTWGFAILFWLGYFWLLVNLGVPLFMVSPILAIIGFLLTVVDFWLVKEYNIQQEIAIRWVAVTGPLFVLSVILTFAALH